MADPAFFYMRATVRGSLVKLLPESYCKELQLR
jgi:hypothetical protein